MKNTNKASCLLVKNTNKGAGGVYVTQCLTGASVRESNVNALMASLLALPTIIHLLTLSVVTGSA